MIFTGYMSCPICEKTMVWNTQTMQPCVYQNYIYLSQRGYGFGLFVCLSVGLLKNYWPNFHETWWVLQLNTSWRVQLFKQIQITEQINNCFPTFINRTEQHEQHFLWIPCLQFILMHYAHSYCIIISL